MADRVDEEIRELCRDITRLGRCGDDGVHWVEFATLFDDEKVTQYYEALVGTLKAAKRSGVIDFKGQMLLKGAHDNVVIKLIKEPAPPAPSTEAVIQRRSFTAHDQPTPQTAPQCEAG